MNRTSFKKDGIEMVDQKPPTAETARCRVCDSYGLTAFFESRQVPVHCNVLWPTQADALAAPRGDIVLGFCPSCGHIFNIAFDPALMTYTETYENSLHFSPRFQQYADSLVDRLIATYDLRGRDIIDIGCGKGDFLKLICARGGNRGVGFDASYEPDAEDGPLPDGVSFVQAFYTPDHAHYPADLMACLHVLEHIEYPQEFVGSIRQAVGKRADTMVYFEVPNALYTLRDMGIWDVIYEHCSYFSAASMARVFTGAGFDVVRLAEAYDGQFLGLDARPAAGATGTREVAVNDLEIMARDVSAFAARYKEKFAYWQESLAQFARQGKKVVIWGAGSKGVTFLNVLATRDQIAYVVDINPRKTGRYVAGTGQQIVTPDFLNEYQPDVVIVMNPIYVDEIRGMLAAKGLTPDVMVV
jgi:SAM-dependent methyltransferase